MCLIYIINKWFRCPAVSRCVEEAAFTTGMEKEECFIVKWRIQNFKYMLENEDLISGQECCLHAGERQGCPTKWRFFLQFFAESDKDDCERSIGIYYELLELPSEKCIHSNFQVMVRGVREVMQILLVDDALDKTCSPLSCSGYENIPLREIEQLELVDGSLVIEIRMVIYFEAQPIVLYKYLYSSVQQESIDQLVHDLKDLFEKVDIGDVELKHAQGSFPCCKGVLSVRNMKLCQILSSNSQNPDKSINLDDFSFKALRTVLGYLHYGQIPDDSFLTWREITDVACLANELVIPNLSNYCDAILADKCVGRNATEMYWLAEELNLSEAKSEILEYRIKSYCSDYSVPSVSTEIDKEEEEAFYTEFKKFKTKTWIPFYRDYNYTRGQTATSGFHKEEKVVTWYINFFNVASKSLEMDSQTITIMASNTTWKFSLTNTTEQDDSWFGIKCKLLNFPSNSQNTFSCFSVELQVPKKKFNFKWQSKVQKLETLMSGFANPKIVKLHGVEEFSSGSNTLPVEENLEIKLRLLVLTPIESRSSTVNSGNEVHSKFLKESKDKLVKDMETLYKSSGGCYSDVKLVSNSGKEFRAHKVLLQARSDVFNTMFHSNLAEENTGTVTLPDISDKGVSFLLQYVYTGQIDVQRVICVKDIGELIYIAEKYNLAELRKYGENLLVARCDLTNALESLEIACKMGMSNAEAYIVQFINNKG